MIKYLFFCLLFIPILELKSQNLVPNGSFEEYTICPEENGRVEYCVGWNPSRISPDYFHACSPHPALSPPDCNYGWQEPLTGDGYLGFVTYYTQIAETREHIMTEFISPLMIGENYFFSFYVVNAVTDDLDQLCWISNGIGLHLSTSEYDVDTQPSPVNPDAIYVHQEMISDTTNWLQIKGSFVADSAYTHLVIGGMLNDSLVTEFNQYCVDETGAAYYFIDEVRLSTDSVYAWEELTTHIVQNEAYDVDMYPNPTQDELIVDINMHFVDRIRLYSINGLLVLEEINPNHSKFDLSNMHNGVYIVELEFKNGNSFHEKIVKSSSYENF